LLQCLRHLAALPHCGASAGCGRWRPYRRGSTEDRLRSRGFGVSLRSAYPLAIIEPETGMKSPVAAERYPLPELGELPDDSRDLLLGVQEKAGFVPNVFLKLARRPAEFRAFFAYHDALMLREESSLTKGEREMIVVATSAANQCLYCVVAHGALLRIYEKKPLVADQVATN